MTLSPECRNSKKCTYMPHKNLTSKYPSQLIARCFTNHSLFRNNSKSGGGHFHPFQILGDTLPEQEGDLPKCGACRTIKFSYLGLQKLNSKNESVMFWPLKTNPTVF